MIPVQIFNNSMLKLNFMSEWVWMHTVWWGH